MKSYLKSCIFNEGFFFIAYNKAVMLCVLLFLSSKSFSQAPNCVVSPTSNCNAVGSGSVYLMSTSTNLVFTFDTFGKFLSGVTENGGTTLKLVVTEALAPCRWQLHVNIDNGGLAPINEWEQLATYGSPGATNPSVNLLQIRARNECNTSLTGNNFFTVANTGVTTPIIQNPGVTQAAGTCLPNINGPGSYLTNYAEYHFTMDYRIIPTLNLRPGMYQLNVRYCLTEDI